MSPTPAAADVRVMNFDPAHVFPPDDPLTLPLLRLMLATDDVRHASALFVMADHQVRETTGVQQIVHEGQKWYLFRLLCSHLVEGGNALNTLVNSVTDTRLSDLLHGRPSAAEALKRLRSAFGADTFIANVRNFIGFHYKQGDIKRVYERDLAAGRVEGSVVTCQVGLLSRFTLTDVLALRLIDEHAGADLASGGEAFEGRVREVQALAVDLNRLVGHLVAALLKRYGADSTHGTIDVPALLRSARDWLEEARERA
jgi:hypothetical protein